MRKAWRALCLVIFVIGSVTYSQVRNDANSNDVEPALPFVAAYVDSYVAPDGKVEETGWRTRYVKADGEWRLVLHGPKSDAGLVEPPVYVGTSEGMFGKGSGLDYRKSFSPPAPKNLLDVFRSHKFLRNHQEFSRTDTIAGLKVYILRVEITNLDDPQQWIERSYSPKTGRNSLRDITHLRDGSEYRSEVTKIEFKEIPENLNDDVKALPVQDDKQKN